MAEKIQFNFIKPADLTIWCTDDDKDDTNNLCLYLEDLLPNEVKIETAVHPSQLKQKLHEKVENNSLTKHNFFISDGSMSFDKTDWDVKPEKSDTKDHYHGTLEVIQGFIQDLVKQGGHFFTTILSQGLPDKPQNFDEISTSDYPLDLPSSEYSGYGNFQDGGPINIPTIRKDEDPSPQLSKLLLHFDKLVGLQTIA